LTDRHETAGCDKSSEVAGNNIELLEEPDIALAFLEGLSFRNMGGDMSDLLLDLLRSSFRENLLNDDRCLFWLVVKDELTG